jgi:hypothetical protein
VKKVSRPASREPVPSLLGSRPTGAVRFALRLPIYLYLFGFGRVLATGSSCSSTGSERQSASMAGAFLLGQLRITRSTRFMNKAKYLSFVQSLYNVLCKHITPGRTASPTLRTRPTSTVPIP